MSEIRIGYARVSTPAQNLHLQTSALEEAGCTRTYTEVASGLNPDRPVVKEVIQAAVESGPGTRILVVRLDRWTRDVVTGRQTLSTLSRAGVHLTSLSEPLDLASPTGLYTATVIWGAAEFEVRQASARTVQGLVHARKRGSRLGRPSILPTETVQEILDLRAGGWSYAQIADHFNATGVPTAHGGRRWYPATVRAVVSGQDAGKLVS